MIDENSLEELDKKRKRLIFRSWHRGTREMDLILGSFADAHVPKFNQDELAMYDEMLNCSDPDLYNWVSGKEEPPANVVNDVFKALLVHKVTPRGA